MGSVSEINTIILQIFIVSESGILTTLCVNCTDYFANHTALDFLNNTFLPGPGIDIATSDNLVIVVAGNCSSVGVILNYVLQVFKGDEMKQR